MTVSNLPECLGEHEVTRAKLCTAFWPGVVAVAVAVAAAAEVVKKTGNAGTLSSLSLPTPEVRPPMPCCQIWNKMSFLSTVLRHFVDLPF